MKTNDFLYEQTIDCIPSADLRAHLKAKPIELSVMQKATIIFNFAENEQIINLFSKLALHTSSLSETELLITAVSEIKTVGYFDKATQDVYERKFPHDTPPYFPFLERCHLPVLFSEHDTICSDGTLYEITAVPVITDNSDFSDECYLCYPQGGGEHQHIHVCNVERPNGGLNYIFETKEKVIL